MTTSATRVELELYAKPLIAKITYGEPFSVVDENEEETYTFNTDEEVYVVGEFPHPRNNLIKQCIILKLSGEITTTIAKQFLRFTN